jgi:polysaccharide export outer membrane protein
MPRRRVNAQCKTVSEVPSRLFMSQNDSSWDEDPRGLLIPWDAVPRRIESAVHSYLPSYPVMFAAQRFPMTFQTVSTATLVVAVLLGSVVRGAQTACQSSQEADDHASRRDVEFDWSLHGRYRLTPTDIVELVFPYIKEFDQTVTVQPDGYITLRAVGELRVQGRTLPELQQMLFQAYQPILREPVITILLKEFEKPYFVAAGEVRKPGKFDLRGATTVTQALTVAGGLTDTGKATQVILFRRYSQDMLEVKQIDVKHMFDRRDLSEDPLLRPGDTLFVPKSLLGRIGRFISRPQFGLYLNPFHY